MSVVRVNYMPKFYFGDDAVLLTLDGGGVDEMRAALLEALRDGSARRTFDEVVNDFELAESGAASVDLTPTHISWKLDSATTFEIVDCLTALRAPRDARTSAGHFYVDVQAPAHTLVISRDEYVDTVYTRMFPSDPE